MPRPSKSAEEYRRELDSLLGRRAVAPTPATAMDGGQLVPSVTDEERRSYEQSGQGEPLTAFVKTLRVRQAFADFLGSDPRPA